MGQGSGGKEERVIELQKIMKATRKGLLGQN